MRAANDTQDVISTPSKIGVLPFRVHLSVLNPTGSGATVYIGGANVSTANYTYALAEGDPPWIADSTAGIPTAAIEWYFATASGTASDVHVCEAN